MREEYYCDLLLITRKTDRAKRPHWVQQVSGRLLLPALWVALKDRESWTPRFPKWVPDGCRAGNSLLPEKKLMQAWNCPNWEEGRMGVVVIWANGAETRGGGEEGEQHLTRPWFWMGTCLASWCISTQSACLLCLHSGFSHCLLRTSPAGEYAPDWWEWGDQSTKGTYHDMKTHLGSTL